MKITTAKLKLQKAIDVLELIEYADKRINGLMNTNYGDSFDFVFEAINKRNKAQVEVTKLAKNRLVKYYEKLIIEISNL